MKNGPVRHHFDAFLGAATKLARLCAAGAMIRALYVGVNQWSVLMAFAIIYLLGGPRDGPDDRLRLIKVIDAVAQRVVSRGKPPLDSS